MRLRRRLIFRVAALLGASYLLSASLLAQTATPPSALTRSNLTVARALVTKPPTPPAPVPPMPWPKSPITFFRELLAMTAAEREQALTNRPPEVRALILAKVREYELLRPDERELRLSVTELRWYLRPLMTAPATNRPAQLALIPERYRQLVADRLQEWDELPPAVQKDLLENEATLSYLAEIEGRSEEQKQEMLRRIPPAQREMLETGIHKWGSMSEDQRAKTLHRFGHFFELNADEKDKVLQTLSEPERRQIEKTLRTFGSLPPDQRARCIRSFAKFASLSLAERQQFLKDAERWKLLSPAERQAWRQLVNTLPPPLPQRTPPLPPLPTLAPRPHPAPTVVTNGK